MDPTLSAQDTRNYIQTLKNDPCAYCDETSTGVDHITPRSQDGADHWENYAGACARCNKSKNYAPLLVFLARRPLHAEKARVQAELDAWNTVIPGGTKRHGLQRSAA